MTTTIDTAPQLEILREVADIQQLGPVFDRLVAVTYGYDGTRRQAKVLNAVVDEAGSQLTILPNYDKADIHYLQADCYDAASGQTQTFTLQGKYRDNGRLQTEARWQFVEEPFSSQATVISPDVSKQFFEPVINAWNALSQDEQGQYLTESLRSQDQRVKSQGYIARLLRRPTIA